MSAINHLIPTKKIACLMAQYNHHQPDSAYHPVAQPNPRAVLIRALLPVFALMAATVVAIPIASSTPSSAQLAPLIETLETTPAAQPVHIPLTIANRLDINRTAEPVSTGVPLARGQATDTGSLWVENSTTGDAVPAQFTVLSRWNGPADDTSLDIKWVLVDLQADVNAKATANFVLRSGSTSDNPPPSTPVTVSDTSDHFDVDTGPLRFRIAKDSFGSLFDGIWIDDNADGTHETTVAEPGSGHGIVITRTDGTTYRSNDDTASPQNVEVETAGPLHTVIKLTGRHTTNTDNGLCVRNGASCGRDQFNYLDYTVRIHAYAGQPYARIFYSVTNPERFRQGQYNQGGDPLFHQWDGFSLNLGLTSPNPSTAFDYVLGAESPDSHEYPGDKSTASGVGAATITGSIAPSSTVELYQDSSGVADWGDSADNKWGTAFQGYRVFSDDSQTDQGLQAAGWATTSTSDWIFGFGLRHFWQNFPKGMSIAGDGAIEIDLWPARSWNPHQFAGGRQKTHELVIGAWAPNRSTTTAPALQAALDPMHLLAENSHYRQSLALGLEPSLLGGSDPNFDYFSETGRLAIEGGTDVWSQRFDEDLYGWRNWGDAYRGGWKDVRYYGNNEFDLSYANLSNYLNSPHHDRRFFDVAESQARHLYDIDVYHSGEDAIAYSWGIHKHDASGVVDHGRSPRLSHFWIRGALNYFLLTGDRFALDAATQTGDHLDNLIDDATGELAFNGESRAQAWALLGLTELWETTGDRRYLRWAGQMAATEIIDEQGLAGATYPCADLDWEGDAGELDKSNVAVWQNGYVAEALGRYALAARLAGQPDQGAETALVRLLNAITECGWATQSNNRFEPDDPTRDNEISGRRYEELVIDRLQSDGSYNISFAINQVLSDGYAYGYIFTGDADLLAMAHRTWQWTMGHETTPGTANPTPHYDATSAAAKAYGFRQRFGHSYLWLLQHLDGGGVTPPPRTTSRPTTTQPTTTTIGPTTTTRPTTTGPATAQPTTTAQPPNEVCGSTSLDFGASSQIAHLTPHSSAFSQPTVGIDNGSSVLAVNANNVDRSYFLTSSDGPLIGENVEASAKVRMAYYGGSRPVGPVHGLILKTLPDPAENDPNLFDGYVVSAFPDRTGIRLRIGVAADANAGFAGYRFRGSRDGHAPFADHLLFPRPLASDGRPHDLGYWTLTGNLSTGADGTVGVTAALADPSGRTETVTWTDNGGNAHTGVGRTGITARGIWSIQNRFDDLDVIVSSGDGRNDTGTVTHNFDFETPAAAQRFTNSLDPNRPPSIVDHASSNRLQIKSSNVSRPHIAKDGQGVPISGSEVTMSVDARMAYYGSKTYRARGPAHGLLLKTIPGSDPPGAAYIVSAQATAAGITVSVGAVEDSSAGAAAYAFLGTGDGHAQAERSDWFPQRFILDNKSSELGYWHLSGDLSVDPTTNTVTIEYALRSPDGTEQTGRWLDDGDSAHIGSGDVGLVNQGVWSIDNRYDNLSITIND